MSGPTRQIAHRGAAAAGTSAAVLAWAAVVAGQATGRIAFTHADFVVWVAPALGLLAAAALRRPLPRRLWVVLWGCMLCSAASAVAVHVVPHTLGVVAIPAALTAAVLATRWPVACLLAVFAICSTYGSLAAFTSISPSKTSELLLGGLWLVVVWRFAVSGRRPKVALVPGVLLLVGFIALTFAQGMGAASLSTGWHTFVSTAFYMSSVVLIGLLDLDARQLRRLARGVVVIAVGVAGYAMLRHGIGPAHKEQLIAAQQPFNYKNGKLLLIGSFESRHQLGQWCALLAAFCAGYGVLARGAMRWGCFAVVVMGALGCLWSESRSGLAAGVAGIVVVLVLLHLARAFPGPRLGAILVAVAVIVIGGAAAITLSGGSQSTQTKKFTDILHPSSDAAYQARQRKWTETVKDIRSQPFGHGLGTANQLQQQQGRFRTIGNFDIDNTVLRVAYEQGVPGALLFIAALLILIVGLARRAVLSDDPARAGPAIAAVAVLVAYAVLLYPSNVFDGFVPLDSWLLVGIGLAPFLAPRPVLAPDRAEASQVPAGPPHPLPA